MEEWVAGEGPVDPLRHLPLGGYGLIAPLDDGTWNMLVQPNASGFGMIVWSLAKTCGNCGDYVEQWLVPALVKWSSLTDPVTGHVSADVLTEFKDEEGYGTRYAYRSARGPMVGIRTLWIPESYECIHWSETICNNLDITTDEECDHGGNDCLGRYTDVGYLTGLAPVFNVIPIKDDLFARWLPLLTQGWAAYATVFENYRFCGCEIEGWEDPECLVLKFEREHEGYNYYSNMELLAERGVAETNCTCGLHTFIDEWMVMLDNPPDFTNSVNEDLFDATWAYALDRYFTGWLAIEEQAPDSYPSLDERNTWLYSFSQRFSPYSGPTGLREYLTTHGLQRYVA